MYPDVRKMRILLSSYIERKTKKKNTALKNRLLIIKVEACFSPTLTLNFLHHPVCKPVDLRLDWFF